MREHRHGRRPNPAELIDSLDGSESAKARLKRIVETLAGDRTIPDASHAVALGESRFHFIRQEALQAALAELEPKPRGRRPKCRIPDDAADQLQRLVEQNRQLRAQLQTLGIQRDLARLHLPLNEEASLPAKNS